MRKSKLFGLVAIMAALWMTLGCGGDANTPKGVVEKAVKCIQDKDYEGYVDLMYVNVKEGEDLKAKKKSVAAMLESKAYSTLDAKGGIQSHEIVSEEIAEDGNTAKVKVKYTFGNGEEKDDTVRLLKEEDGNWKIDSGK